MPAAESTVRNDRAVWPCLPMSLPVSDAGGNGDDRNFYEASDDRRESTFHSGATDDDIGCAESVELGEQAVETSDSNIGDAGNFCAEELGSDSCFFRDGEIAGSCADYGYVALRWRGSLREGDAAG